MREYIKTIFGVIFLSLLLFIIGIIIPLLWFFIPFVLLSGLLYPLYRYFYPKKEKI